MGKVYNWTCVAIAGCGSVLYGYDAAVIAGTFAQPGFLAYFNPSATLQGAIGSAYFGGLLLGLLFVSLLADTFGRKRTIQFGAVVGIVGGIVQTVATNIATFLAGRAIAGMASGIMLTTVNVYQAEISPPALRGTMVAVQIVTLNVAGTLASWVGYACYFSKNPIFQWRFPIALQIVPALLLICGCFYIPFSPRWLISKGRHDEAKAILRRLHDDHQDPAFWEKEYLQISAQISFEQREKSKASWTQILTNTKELRRVFIAVAALVSVQTNGAQTIQVYQTVLYAGLGFSTEQTLLMAGVFGIINTLGGCTNLVLIDRVGRRKLFLTGLILLSVWLGIFSAASSEYATTGNPKWGKTGVAFVMIFIYTFGSTYAASPYAYAAEVLPTKNRAIGVALALFCANSITLTFSQTQPIALQTIGWKFNLVFIACNLFFLPVVYFFFKETKGLTLEEVNLVFGETVELSMREINDNSRKISNVDYVETEA